MACLTIAIIILLQALPVSNQINWNISASRNKCILENQEVRMVCSYDGAHSGKVVQGSWSKNGRTVYGFLPYLNSGSYVKNSDWDGRKDVSLVANNITSFEIKFSMRKVDEGNYTCSIEVRDPGQIFYSAEKQIPLSVSVPPSDPQIEVVGNKLVCTSDGGVPPPTFSWNPTPTGTVNTTDTTSTISTDGRSSYTCNVNHCTGEKSDSYSFEASRITEVSTQPTLTENSKGKQETPTHTCPTPNNQHELGWGLTAGVMFILCLVSLGANVFSYKIRSLSKLKFKKGKPVDDRPDQAYENIQGLSDGPRPTYADGQSVNVDIQLQTRDEHPIGINPQEDTNPYEHLNDAERGPYLNTNLLLSGPYEALRI